MGAVAVPAPESAKTVICIGGSTTFGYRVGDEQTWPARLQARLADDARVVNMGCYGYSTVEAVIQTALLVPEHAPAVCIYHQGWNDAHVMHMEDPDPAYANYHGRSQVMRVVGKRDRVSGQTPLMIVYSLNEIVQRVARTPDPWSDFRPPARGSDVPVDAIDTRALALYRRNLHTLVSLCRAQGIAPVFVPQVLDDSRLQGDAVWGWAPRVRDSYLREAMAEYNRTMEDVCRETGTRFVREVLDRAWRAEEFVDIGHMTPAGYDALAEAVVPAVRDALGSTTAPGNPTRR